MLQQYIGYPQINTYCKLCKHILKLPPQFKILKGVLTCVYKSNLIFLLRNENYTFCSTNLKTMFPSNQTI